MLKDYCFSQGICKVDNCLKPMILHDRSFCHYKGRINITTENASEFLEKLDSNTDIICWSSCPKCEITTPFVTMTSESLDYSFGKLSWRNIKRFIKQREKKSDENLKNLIRIIKYVKNYRKGVHGGSYKSHKEIIDKHQINLVIIKNNKQLKEFMKSLDEKRLK